MRYVFHEEGVDLSYCEIDCAELSDEEVWQLVLSFFRKLDPPSNDYLWIRWKDDILKSYYPQPVLCEGCLDIHLDRGKLIIRTHHNRCDQGVLDRFKKAVEQILGNP